MAHGMAPARDAGRRCRPRVQKPEHQTVAEKDRSRLAARTGSACGLRRLGKQLAPRSDRANDCTTVQYASISFLASSFGIGIEIQTLYTFCELLGR